MDEELANAFMVDMDFDRYGKIKCSKIEQMLPKLMKIEKNTMEKVVQQIIELIPDDNSGSTISNRYGYQKNWAMMKMLELEKRGRDYMIVFDYHEDIMVIDSLADDPQIDFFQVKSLRGDYWLMRDLYKAKDGEKLSILAKLLKHSVDFTRTRDFYFVTNSFFNTTQYSKGENYIPSKVPFSKFHENIRKKTKEKVKQDIPELKEGVWEHLYVSQEQLSVNDYKSELLHEIQMFIDEKIPLGEIKRETMYDALLGEIEGKQNYDDLITDETVLTTRKSIRHEEFANFIKQLSTFKSYDDHCKIVRNEYLKEAKPGEINLKREMEFRIILNERIKTWIYNYNDVEFLQLCTLIKNMVNEYNTMDMSEDDNYWTAANNVLAKLKDVYNNYRGFSDDELLALILLEYAR